MKNSWKKMILTAAALTALALFAGCTTASAVSLEEAKTLVQETMGAKDAVVIEQETDREDGVYELEIIVDGTAYEFEVDSATGAIRELERETPKTTRPAETKPAEMQPVETQPAQTQTITLDEAKAIAYAHAGISESDAYDRSYERDDGIFEIDFDHDGWEYEYHISREGEILNSRKERDDDRRPAQTQPAETKPAEQKTTEKKSSEKKTTEKKSDRISAEKALSIALGHAGVSDAFDREVEWDDGRWEVSFQSGRTEYDYDISADGTILHWEKELDD